MNRKKERLNLKVLTYNIRGSLEYNLEKRLDEFLNRMKIDSPDIVVVQEGTRVCYEKLLREMGLLGYKRQICDIMNHRPVGELLFSKYPVSSGDFIPFRKTAENRGISLFRVDLGRKDVPVVWIGTTQLDSTVAIARSQIRDLNFLLKSIPGENFFILAGDFRISEYQADLKEPEGWKDAWYEAGSDSEKYTIDHTTNLLVNPPYRDRPDRVWYRPLRNSAHEQVVCESCTLYGRDSTTTISPHYGVMAIFSFSLSD
jgi:endonuclease/exonuclease/phosphatase family metal-dependent hydrolase